MRLALFPATVALLLANPAARAIDYLSTTNYVVAKGETVAREQWIYTIDADVAGTIKHDLFILSGNRLKLSGVFERGVWGIGGDVSLSGDAAQSVRLLGTSIDITGRIGDNLVALGNSVHTATNSAVAGDVELVGNQVILEGRSDGDATIMASRLATISGSVAGNLTVVAPEIVLQRTARIGGNLTYTCGQELLPEEGVVGGKLVRKLPPPPPPAWSAARLAAHLAGFLAALVVAVPFIALFPVTVAMATQQFRVAPWKCLLAGLLASVALPVVGAVCIFSVVGLPLGLLLFAGWGTMLYLGRIVTALVVGSLVLRATAATAGRVLATTAAGLAAIYAGTLLPGVGVPLLLAATWMGMGSLLMGLIERRRLVLQMPHPPAPLDPTEKQREQTKEETP